MSDEVLTFTDESIFSPIQRFVSSLGILVVTMRRLGRPHLVDFDSEYWPEELDIAFLAWRTVTNKLDRDKSTKKQITDWLNENYRDLSEQAKTRIATVCNWNTGGRPKSR